MSIQQLQSQQGFGSWAGESVEDIEAYLVNSQRKFVKYRLNIFVLNRVSLSVCPPGVVAAFPLFPPSSSLKRLIMFYACLVRAQNPALVAPQPLEKASSR